MYADFWDAGHPCWIWPFTNGALENGRCKVLRGAPDHQPDWKAAGLKTTQKISFLYDCAIVWCCCVNCSTQMQVIGFIIFICVYLRNAFEYTYLNPPLPRGVSSLWNPHKSEEDIWCYLRGHLPSSLFLQGKLRLWEPKKGKNKIVMQSKSKSFYYFLLSATLWWKRLHPMRRFFLG